MRYPALLGGTAGFLAADFGDQAVSHNTSGHASNSWLENDGQPAEELWCPLWEEPVTFHELRDELARVALLPLPRQLRTGTDFALFASQLGRRHGLSAFARYCFPPRVGQGTKIPSLIEVFPLHDDQEDRSDALAGVAGFASTLRWRAADRSIPTSYRPNGSACWNGNLMDLSGAWAWRWPLAAPMPFPQTSPFSSPIGLMPTFSAISRRASPGSTALAGPLSPNPKNLFPGSRPTTSPGCSSTSGASMPTPPSKATVPAGGSAAHRPPRGGHGGGAGG